MSSESRNSFDLELNPFERSFASKDQQHQAGASASGAAVAGVSGVAPGEPPIPKNSTSQGTSSQIQLNKPGVSTNGTKGETPTSSSNSSKLETSAASAQSTATSTSSGNNDREQTEPGSAGSNKHNLRLSNLSSVAAPETRLPGLTPPIFTPGGRRLPPIHLSPNATMGTPDTPGGSSLWSSLLSATNGQGHDGSTQAQNSNYAQFANMMRKSGLTPNESNLRSGLTPGVGHQTFNFGHIPGLTPGGLSNGQMTPGLSSFLGLSHHQPTQGDAVQGAPGGHSQAQPLQQRPQFPAPQSQQNRVQPPPPQISAAPAEDHTFAIPTEPVKPVPAVKQEEDPVAKEGPPAKKSKTTASKSKKEKKKDTETKKKAANAQTNEEEEKRKNFLERNRVAASKCRQRKKQMVQKMEEELAFYSSGYRELSAQVTQLREQLLTLRGVVTSLKNSPVLINAVGGYQQLQNILSQTDYIAQAAANSQPNFHSMPSTIPTTLNASSQGSSQSPPQIPKFNGQQHGQAASPGHTALQGNHRNIAPNQHHGMTQMPYQQANVNIPPEAPVEEVPRHFTGEMGLSNMSSVDNTGQLKSSSSTSNLQNNKIDDGGYTGLRNVVSMANLQG
ncbi:hypothetical_protein [Candidozyma auris]|uniref:hypothetical_protein n=1 Tax=Candidozyma auris TaxID=498019 RepID=UPI000D29EF95|nr:hypothetical_protein [[Candida] auris]QEO20935.1 hypothetical_protein [[Candida] auris]